MSSGMTIKEKEDNRVETEHRRAGEEDRRKEERRRANREEALLQELEEINHKKTWWDGNQTRVWRTFVVIFIGIMSFISAWIFNNVDQTKTDVASLSGKFATKEELKCAVEKTEMTINRGFDSFDRKLDDLNKYLRDNVPRK